MTKQDKVFMVMGGVLLSTGAMLSAYGFHGLADSLTEADRLSWRWAVQMQTYHSLAHVPALGQRQPLGGDRGP